MAGTSKDDIPELHDVVRPGAEGRGQQQDDRPRAASLTENEIEAIAARVIERYSDHLEQAVARAISAALEAKSRPQNRSGEDEGEG